MIHSKLIQLATTIVLLLIGGIALAMSPGSSIAHWKPEKIHQLSPNEVRELNADKCLVASYRDMDSPTNTLTDAPDEQDKLTLVRGEFAAKGQNDLLVLCKSSKNNTEFFRVVWGGSKQCPNTLLMSEVSRFMKKRDPEEDYYGSRLRGRPASETLRLLDAMKEQFKDASQDGITKQWIIEKQNIPKLEHNTMWFSGHYAFAFYCNGKDWVQLYDYFSSETD